MSRRASSRPRIAAADGSRTGGRALAGEELIEQRGIVAERAPEGVLAASAHSSKSASSAPPVRRGLAGSSARRKRRHRRAMRGEQSRRAALRRRARARGRAPSRDRASRDSAARRRPRRSPDGGMGVAVLGGRAGGGEGVLQVVERGGRRGAEARRVRARAPRPRVGALRPNRVAGWANSAWTSERGGNRPPPQHQPRKRAGFGLAERPAGGILDLDPPAGEFRRDAAGDRGSGVISAAVLPGVSSTSRIATASASASSASLSATIPDVRERLGDRGGASAASRTRQASVESAGPQRLAHQRGARAQARATRAERLERPRAPRRSPDQPVERACGWPASPPSPPSRAPIIAQARSSSRSRGRAAPRRPARPGRWRRSGRRWRGWRRSSRR